MTTRRVCHMSPQEVEKKRQIDRDNQRHFRHKRKAHILKLEQEISDLKHELYEVQQRLRSQSLCATCGARQPAVTTDLPIDQLPIEALPALDNGSRTLDLVQSPWSENKANLPLDLGQGFTLNMLSNESGPHFLDINFGMMPGIEDNVSDMVGRTSRDSSREGGRPWETVPLHTPPASRLDHAIERISSMARGLLLERQTLRDELSQPTFPSISSLLNPSMGRDDSRSISSAVAAHVWTSPVDSTTSRIAFMYILSYLLRWLICRDENSYNQLPDFIKPTKRQCTVPHPAWIGTVAW